MNFLEAHRILREFRGGEPLALRVAASGNVDPLRLYLEAQGATRQRTVTVHTLPFNTLQQFLASAPVPDMREVFVLFPWDFVEEADWRSGIPTERPVLQQLLDRATDRAQLIRDRGGAVICVDAPLPPLMADSAETSRLRAELAALASGLRATIVDTHHFSLASYFSSGCGFSGSSLSHVAKVVLHAALRTERDAAKLLVTDLDNVMWKGVLAEDGLAGIHYRAEGAGYPHFVYQTVLARYRREGVLVAAVSRNDAAVVAEALEHGNMMLRREDFVSVLASYNAKSAQIRELAERLNLGLDAIVFVDDNPIELEEVRLALPTVHTLLFPDRDDGLRELLASLDDLFGGRKLTLEDRERTELYRRRVQGMAPSAAAGADLSAFLKGLAMRITIHDRSLGDRARAVQLINKTNQFNANGRRFEIEEVEAVLRDGGRLFTASLEDRTGTHGEILACLIDAESTIVALVMSCRVFQRRVEYAFLVWLTMSQSPPSRIAFQETPRNEPFRQFTTDAALKTLPNGFIGLESGAFASYHREVLALFDLTPP